VVDAAEGIVGERYAGVREAGAAEPIGPETLFALASLTKPLVAAACLVGAEEGLLDLDEPVRDGFGLRHLLSHCSGLPTDGDLVDAPPLETPGSYRRYSNAGYRLAGSLLSGAAGMALPTYLRAAVLEPLAMDASLGLEPERFARAATVREPGRSEHGYKLFNDPEFRASATASGGGYATAHAYAAFLLMLLRGGAAADGTHVLAAETVGDMLVTQFGSPPGEVPGVGRWDAVAWGLGMDVRGTRNPHWTGPALSPDSSTHFGAAGTLCWIDPQRGLGLVVLANRGTYGGWWSGEGGWAALTSALVAR